MCVYLPKTSFLSWEFTQDAFTTRNSEDKSHHIRENRDNHDKKWCMSCRTEAKMEKDHGFPAIEKKETNKDRWKPNFSIRKLENRRGQKKGEKIDRRRKEEETIYRWNERCKKEAGKTKTKTKTKQETARRRCDRSEGRRELTEVTPEAFERNLTGSGSVGKAPAILHGREGGRWEELGSSRRARRRGREERAIDRHRRRDSAGGAEGSRD